MASVKLDQTHLKSTTSTETVTIILKAPITSDSWLAPSPGLTSLEICPENNLPPLKGATASFHRSTVSINRLFRHRINWTICSHNFGNNREVVGNPRVPAHMELWFLPQCGKPMPGYTWGIGSNFSVPNSSLSTELILCHPGLNGDKVEASS